MQNSVQQTWFFHRPPGEVWDYLTKPELIELWLMENDFKPVIGQKFQFIYRPAKEGAAPVYHYCQVLEMVPHKLLSYSFRKGKSEKEYTLDSVVTWTLTGKNGGTELQLQHNGFTILKDVVEHNDGWNFLLNRLTERLKVASNADANV
ncbi:MAG TPA: SRPBCC domain-containing protein [Puia sp.]|jgi:uncharacterized protein YndB with AHSA1/START domain|nr:SRPBCC domain-containing protein [Puia sp.]